MIFLDSAAYCQKYSSLSSDSFAGLPQSLVSSTDPVSRNLSTRLRTALRCEQVYLKIYQQKRCGAKSVYLPPSRNTRSTRNISFSVVKTKTILGCNLKYKKLWLEKCIVTFRTCIEIYFMKVFMRKNWKKNKSFFVTSHSGRLLTIFFRFNIYDKRNTFFVLFCIAFWNEEGMLSISVITDWTYLISYNYLTENVCL